MAATIPLRGVDPPLSQLYRHEAPRLMRYLRKRCGDRDVADDLVQEAFARLCAAERRVPLRSAEAYLRRIVQTLLIDRFKRSGSAVQEVAIDAKVLERIGVAPEQELRIEARQLKARFNAALATLTPRTRQVFELHRNDGLRYSDIAHELGITVSAVEYHMTRALVHLDRELGAR